MTWWMLKSWGLTWKKWRISPVTSDWVCLPQFPYHMKFRLMQFSYNFLYLHIHFLEYPCALFTKLYTWELPNIIIILLLTTEQHCRSDWELGALLKDNWYPILFSIHISAHSTSYFSLFLSTSTSKRFWCICGKDSDAIHQPCKGHAQKSL